MRIAPTPWFQTLAGRRIRRKCRTEFRFRTDGVCCVYVAASSRCFSDVPFDQACQTLSDLEFDHLELCVDDDGHIPITKLVSAPEDFVNGYRETTRLTPVTVTLMTEFTMEQFNSICKTAKSLRVATLVVSAAPNGTPFNEEIDRLRELTRIASETSVRVAVRTERNRMADDPQAAVELCKHVTGLGLSFDPSHFLTGGATMDNEAIYSHIFHVQLRDSTPTDIQVPLGLGEIDYAKIVSSLEKSGYRQALSVDLIPGSFTGETRLLEMRKTRRLIDTLL